MVTAEITTESLAIFSEQALVYFTEPDSVKPAEFVCINGYPCFFKPYRCDPLQ